MALPIPMCCISGDAPNEPPLETSRYRIGFACPRPASVSLILAPIAALLLFTPTSLMEIQRFEWPGFMKRTLLYLSPGTAPPRFSKRSSLPSLSTSAKETPCPFCRCPVPLEELMSTKYFPS